MVLRRGFSAACLSAVRRSAVASRTVPPVQISIAPVQPQVCGQVRCASTTATADTDMVFDMMGGAVAASAPLPEQPCAATAAAPMAAEGEEDLLAMMMAEDPRSVPTQDQQASPVEASGSVDLFDLMADTTPPVPVQPSSAQPSAERSAQAAPGDIDVFDMMDFGPTDDMGGATAAPDTPAPAAAKTTSVPQATAGEVQGEVKDAVDPSIDAMLDDVFGALGDGGEHSGAPSRARAAPSTAPGDTQQRQNPRQQIIRPKAKTTQSTQSDDQEGPVCDSDDPAVRLSFAVERFEDAVLRATEYSISAPHEGVLKSWAARLDAEGEPSIGIDSGTALRTLSSSSAPVADPANDDATAAAILPEVSEASTAHGMTLSAVSSAHATLLDEMGRTNVQMKAMTDSDSTADQSNVTEVQRAIWRARLVTAVDQEAVKNVIEEVVSTDQDLLWSDCRAASVAAMTFPDTAEGSELALDYFGAARQALLEHRQSKLTPSAVAVDAPNSIEDATATARLWQSAFAAAASSKISEALFKKLWAEFEVEVLQDRSIEAKQAVLEEKYADANAAGDVDLLMDGAAMSGTNVDDTGDGSNRADDESDPQTAEFIELAKQSVSLAQVQHKALEHAVVWCVKQESPPLVMMLWQAARDLAEKTGAPIPLSTHAQLLMAATALGRFDGGIQAALMAEFKATVTGDQLKEMEWVDFAVFSRALSLESLLLLARCRSGGNDAGVPVAVWLLILRSLCFGRRVSEAEALFTYLVQSRAMTQRGFAQAFRCMLVLHAKRKDSASAIDLFAKFARNAVDTDEQLLRQMAARAPSSDSQANGPDESSDGSGTFVMDDQTAGDVNARADTWRATSGDFTNTGDAEHGEEFDGRTRSKPNSDSRECGIDVGESYAVEPTTHHYKLLLATSDSTNMTECVFLEAAAAGVALDSSAYSALFKSLTGGASGWNAAQVPEPPSSRLDERMSMPQDVDAHVVRDEAQRARGVRVMNST